MQVIIRVQQAENNIKKKQKATRISFKKDYYYTLKNKTKSSFFILLENLPLNFALSLSKVNFI